MLAFLGLPVAGLLFLGAGLGGRVGQIGCLLCKTAFQRGCCKAHPQVL